MPDRDLMLEVIDENLSLTGRLEVAHEQIKSMRAENTKLRAQLKEYRRLVVSQFELYGPNPTGWRSVSIWSRDRFA